MTFGKRLRALKRVWERAALRLHIAWMEWRLSRRTDRALTKIEMGAEICRKGESIGDGKMIADGIALVLRGWSALVKMGVKP